MTTMPKIGPKLEKEIQRQPQEQELIQQCSTGKNKQYITKLVKAKQLQITMLKKTGL